jgi:hypothetical protein
MKSMSGARLFMNFTSDVLIGLPMNPSGKPTNEDFMKRHSLMNLQIPLDVGTFRKLKLKSEGIKRNQYAIDVVFHPMIMRYI